MTERIISLADIGDPLRVQPLAEAIFGRGDRRPDWFARKLVREHVDPGLSQLAIAGEPGDPACWGGYVLVGTPPSRAPAARTAGTGVRVEARGRGLGTALLEAAANAARCAGFAALELWAEHARGSFYAAHGFVVQRSFETWLTFARGQTEDRLPAPLPFDRTKTLVIGEFLREAWEHSDAGERHSFDHGGVRVQVAREGVAFAIHRVLADPEIPADLIAEALRRVVERLPAPAPIVAIALDTVSSITGPLGACLARDGWRVVQRGAVMLRQLGACDAQTVDKGRSPPR